MMGKIYTRTGDDGTTGIHGGDRVAKDDPRIEANGALDELNCHLGIVRSQLLADDPWQEQLHRIQQELMVVMSLVATPSDRHDRNPNRFDETLTADCEHWIDTLSAECTDRRYFVLPGGTPQQRNCNWHGPWPDAQNAAYGRSIVSTRCPTSCCVSSIGSPICCSSWPESK